MGIGKAVKNLFWRSEGDDEQEAAEELTEGDEGDFAEDFAALLGDDPNFVKPDAVVEASTVALSTNNAGAIVIDFHAQYNLAAIPDTDEVEQLENFLTRLDQQLPHASKIAAAQAFLGAIGKGKEAVLQDAERKIRRVHGILSSQQADTQRSITDEQASIDSLQAQINQHRERMEALNRELEGVRKACIVEEGRLQAARVFFGHVESPPAE